MMRAVLVTELDAPSDVVLVPESSDLEQNYIAIRSVPGITPPIPWVIAEARKSPSVEPGSLKIHPFVLGKISRESSEVEFKYIDPVKLTKVILTAPGPILAELEKKTPKTRHTLHIPDLLRQGQFLADMNARVKACEPADQGIITDDTEIAIAAEPTTSHSDQDDLEPPAFLPNDIAGDLYQEFLDQENGTDVIVPSNPVTFTVTPLASPISAKAVRPTPAPSEDLENAGLLRVDQFRKLGAFSGDYFVISNSDQTRVIRLYAFPEPEPAWAGANLCLPPVLIHNLGMMETVQVRLATQEEFTFPEAKDVVLCRVASPISTNRAYQQAFISALKEHFTGKSRIVKSGDIIGVAIDTMLAQSFYNPNSDLEIPPGLEKHCDQVVWFRVEGDTPQSIMNPSHTRMVQSGLCQTIGIPSSLKWQSYFGLAEPFDYESNEGFSYAKKLKKSLEASLTARGSTLGTTLLLTSSRRGAGKQTVIENTASLLGIHHMTLECYDMVGDGDNKVLGALSARLDRATACSPCVVILKHFEAIAKRGEQDGRDGPITSDLVSIISDAMVKPGLVIAATTQDPDKLSDTVRNCFKFEIDVTVPTETERHAIIEYLTDPRGPLLSTPIGLDTKSTFIEGYALRGDVSTSSLAIQSAGLTPPDLVSIVKGARQAAHSSTVNNVASIICQRGIIKITPKDIESAVSAARDSYSDSIGAPKIPNVGWKDVGGLDNVKGEIMDTIDMPLKYPHLFASGLKKRSGILFYGPPGTGKTLLAKAIATSFSLNFFSVKGPELLNMYIGESEANVRRVFQKARDAKPCVVFFDELDSVAPKRGNQGDSGGVMDRIVSQLLAELDGMSSGADGVFVIGATNRPDLLDEALLRPGRFDKMLYLGVSDTHEKQKKILQALTRKFDLAEDVDLATVAASCPFTYTGADFYAMSSDAMLNAMTRTAGEVDKKIELYNETHPDAPLSTRAWFQKIATPEDMQVQVTHGDFAKSLRELIPSVSADELLHYQQVRATFEDASSKSPEKGPAQKIDGRPFNHNDVANISLNGST